MKFVKFVIDKSLLPSLFSPVLLLIFESHISNFCRKFNFNNSIVNSIILALFSIMIQTFLEWWLVYYENHKIDMKLIISENKNNFNIDSSVKLDLSKSNYIYLEVRLDGYKKYIEGNEVVNIFFPEDVDIDFPFSRENSFFEIEGNDLKINLNEIFQKDQKEIRNYGHVIKLAILPAAEIIDSTGVTVEVSSNTSKRCKRKNIRLQSNYEMFTITKGEG